MTNEGMEINWKYLDNQINNVSQIMNDLYQPFDHSVGAVSPSSKAGSILAATIRVTSLALLVLLTLMTVIGNLTDWRSYTCDIDSRWGLLLHEVFIP